VNIDIANQGTGPGTLTGISVTGTGSRVTGAPLLPATIAAGQSLRLGVIFAPTQNEVGASGAVTVSIP
jgi:hypothetical protein